MPTLFTSLHINGHLLLERPTGWSVHDVMAHPLQGSTLWTIDCSGWCCCCCCTPALMLGCWNNQFNFWQRAMHFIDYSGERENIRFHRTKSSSVFSSVKSASNGKTWTMESTPLICFVKAAIFQGKTADPCASVRILGYYELVFIKYFSVLFYWICSHAEDTM